MEKISELKERHKGEWLAIRVTRREAFEPVEGELVYHSQDQKELLKNVSFKFEGESHIYITYAGPFIHDGYMVGFYANQPG